MRLLVGLVTALISFAGAESAQALSCAPPPAPLERFQSADVAVVASLVSSEPIAPALPPPGPPAPIGWGPTGPVVLARYRVVRVFKADVQGPRVGDLFSQWGRVARGTWRPPWGRVTAFVLKRENGDLDGRLSVGACARDPLTRTEIRAAALLNRYGPGRGAASHRCFVDSCWSIKRDGREAIFRVASFDPDGNLTPLGIYDYNRRYDLCVRAPDRSTTCKRFAMAAETAGLVSSRVRWSRHFPNRGKGVYRAQWRPPGLERQGSDERRYGKYLPSLSFRR